VFTGSGDERKSKRVPFGGNVNEGLGKLQHGRSA